MENFYPDKPMRLDVKCFVDFLCWYYKCKYRVIPFGLAFYEFMEFDKMPTQEGGLKEFNALMLMTDSQAKNFIQDNFEFV